MQRYIPRAGLYKERHRVTLAWARPVRAWLWLLLLLCLAQPAAAQVQPLPEEVWAVAGGKVYLVGLSEDADRDALAAALPPDAVVLRTWPHFRLAEVRMRDRGDKRAAEQELYSALLGSPAVVYVEPDMPVRSAGLPPVARQVAAPTAPDALPPPNDPLFSEQWALARIGALDAWNVSVGDSRLAIAVIDSGVDSAHPDLPAARLWVNPVEAGGAAGVDDDGNGYIDDLHGWDWVRGSSALEDPNGHGMHVAGIAGAAVDNGVGIAGVGRAVRIMPLRILNEWGVGRVSNLIAALDYARATGVRVVNLSVVLPLESTALRDAVETLERDGVLVAAAAGNAAGPVAFPAAYAAVIAVGATNEADEVASFSNFGPELDLAAPGSEILSAFPAGIDGSDDGYALLSGASMAAPHVAATAALVWSLRPNWTLQEVRAVLEETAVDANASTRPGRDPYLGAGRLAAGEALLAASEGLRLEALPIPAGVTVGAPFTVTFSVASPANGGAAAVAGAVVDVELRSPAGAPLQAQAAPTDRAGLAVFPFAPAPTPGSYRLTARVGRTAIELTVVVEDTPARVVILPARISAQAGGPSRPVRIELRSAVGALVFGRAPIRLDAAAGAFTGPDGSSTVAATDGAYDAIYTPPTLAGRHALTATLGNLSGQAAADVAPGSPARIIAATPVAPIALWRGDRTARLLFYLQDAYGNSTDGRIHFRAEGGSLSALQAETSAGQAAVIFTLSDPSRARVIAYLPGLSTQAVVAILAQDQAIWLPSIHHE